MLAAVVSVSGTPAQERYDAGKKAMAAGDLNAALDHFHFACGLFTCL
jgi:hypothetical protein